MRRPIRMGFAGVLAVGLTLLAAGPGSASATVVNTQTDVPVRAVLADPCSLDVVAIDGDAHVVTHVTFVKGMANLGVHLNLSDVHATGSLSGAKYTGNGTVELSAKVNGPFPAGFTAPGHFFLLRQGAGNDLKVGFLLKGKVQKNGQVTDLTIEIKSLECGEFDII